LVPDVGVLISTVGAAVFFVAVLNFADTADTASTSRAYWMRKGLADLLVLVENRGVAGKPPSVSRNAAIPAAVRRN
jgi:hypothetical protein